MSLTANNAKEIVHAAMVENVPLVLDLYSMHLSKADWRKIVEESVRCLLYNNKAHGLRHIFIEEAAEFCPQVVGPEMGRVYAEIEKLARMGGNASLGYTLINQRAEQVNKAVLELCDCLFLHRQKGKNSLTSLGRWLDFADASKSKEIIKSLPGLGQGECWVWPQGSDEPRRTKMPEKRSFHPDRRNPDKAKAKASTDVSAFVRALAAALPKLEQERKDNDPKELRNRVQALEHELKISQSRKGEVSPEQLKTAHKKGYEEGLRMAKEELKDSLHIFKLECKEKLGLLKTSLENFQPSIPKGLPVVYDGNKIVDHLPDPAPRARLRRIQGEQVEQVVQQGQLAEDRPKGGMRRMMVALAQRPGLNAGQLGIRAGLSSRSGTFGTYLGTLRSKGWLVGGRDHMDLTDAGLIALGPYDALPEGKELLAYWLGELGSGGASRMLSALAEAYPGTMTREELGQAAGISSDSGTFGTYLSKLRKLELVEGSKFFQANPELYEFAT